MRSRASTGWKLEAYATFPEAFAGLGNTDFHSLARIPLSVFAFPKTRGWLSMADR